MTITEFNDELKKINNNSWGFGNEILYLMARDPHDLRLPDKHSGAMMLIGRAYAASPQRRSYGTTKNEGEYIGISGKITENRPIWPVQTQNDGRGGFFDYVSEKVSKRIEADEFFNQMIENHIKNHSDGNAGYAYNGFCNDIEMLTESILAVLRYNLFLGRSLEEYDKVPEGNKFEGDDIYCNNHISFSGKLLHFYFPHRVFIMDSYSRDGGKYLFGGYKENNSHALYNAPDGNTRFDSNIYAQFSGVKDICDKIYKHKAIKDITEEYNKRTKFRQTASEDNTTVKDYIEHCARSYLLGYHIVKSEIHPIDQIKYSTGYSVKSMPRLTDSIFLNIKAKLPEAVTKHCESVKKIYGI